MATLEIRHEVDRFVLYFDTPRREISAYALATALVGLADAVREANAIVNPGYVVEVVVEALSDGSFKATVRTIFTKAKNLFSHQAVQAVIWGIVATHIYEKAIKTEVPPNITVTDTLVTIEIGNEKIIVPKDVYEAKKQVERSERFNNALGKVFDAAASDPNVEGIAIVDDTGPQRPPLIVPREKFALFQTEQPVDESTREIVEITHVEISRAILERGKRRWEFFWRGVRIAAPVLDQKFFDRFFAHEIMIAPGDSLEVALRIVQEKKPDSGIYVNVRYEIVEVFQHLPRLTQHAL
ncbi:hypothetical protein [Hydrogenophaga sp.]|uniref:hypothetical protein n=1 Tax=Hydrogenophaga sp. TaxID=1904254 RepID=UPI001A62E5BE|nr:hypothetical protein [Hydrogenophaga sp.]MBL9170907.1 hypothetical protein [Verrucomicrobiales bacterium]MCW5652485.1 hypothetical protein [Hydrogenophaga sp.]